MKILVTGANGFIGSNIIPKLAAVSNNNIILTSRSEINTGLYKQYNNISFVQYDIKERDLDIFNKFKQPEAVLHLAWDLLPDFHNPKHIEDLFLDNYLFLKTLIKSGINNVNVIGTCLEYGLVNGELDESLSTAPTTSYGFSKDILRRTLELLQLEVNFDLKWLRLFYIYNPTNLKSRLIQDIIKVVDKEVDFLNLSKGDQLRDYLDLDELCNKIINIVNIHENVGIVNCSSGKPIEVKEIVNRILDFYKIKPIINYGYYDYPSYESFEFWGSTKKYNSLMGINN